LNGTETQGKNYSDTDLCIINSKIDTNFKDRLIINNVSENSKILDINEAALRNVIQGIGRIERTDNKNQLYKAVIIIGDVEELTNKFMKEKKNNSINFKLINEKRLNINKLLDNIDDKIRNINLKDDKEKLLKEEIECIDKNKEIKEDKRKKYHHDDILKFYETTRKNMFEITEIYPKDTYIYNLIKEETGITYKTFKRIINKSI
jgi:hypothetical protein